MNTIIKRLFPVAILLIVLSMILGGCAKSTSSTQTSATTPNATEANNTLTPAVPPLNDNTASVQVEITYDQLLNEQHISKDVKVTFPGSLILILGSNPTTGFQWQTNADIGNTAVLSQYTHQFVEPQSTLVGAAGNDVYTFKTLAKGTSTVQLQYSRPWEGGEKAEWTVDLTVTVD